MVTRPNDERRNRSLHGLSRTLVANLVTKAGADLVKLLDTSSGRVWSAVDGSGGMLELTPGEEIISYLSFGKVDTDTVTVMVPMAGFTTVSVLNSDDAKKAGINLATAKKELAVSRDRATALQLG